MVDFGIQIVVSSIFIWKKNRFDPWRQSRNLVAEKRKMFLVFACACHGWYFLIKKLICNNLAAFGPSNIWKHGMLFSLFSYCFCVCGGFVQSFCYWDMPIVFNMASQTCMVLITWHVCVCSLHGICVFITWHVYVQYMSCFGSKKSKLSFAKPVGLQFSCCHITSLLPRADVMLPCTKHMHTPTYCMGIFHTWLLLNVLAQVLHVYWQLGLIDLCCLFYMPWAHQVPMSLQNHTCSNGGNLKSFALVIIHLEPTCSVML